MIDKLIKLANDMDAKGLTAEADRLDAIISKMAEEGEMPGKEPKKGPKTKEDLIGDLFGTGATAVRDGAGLVTIETNEPFAQAASQCMLEDQCVYMDSLKEIHIKDNEGNMYKIFEEKSGHPASRIIIETMLLN